MNTLHSQMCADMVLRGMSPRTPQHYRGRQRGAAATRPPKCLFPADGQGGPTCWLPSRAPPGIWRRESWKNSAKGHQGADLLGHPGRQSRPRRRDFFQFGRWQLGAQLLDRFPCFFRA